ncbi:MAG: hypothetical protein IAE78_24890 [Myxococcus sp.]|nr:hypothetical protein [Myxococcus sp.]
MLALLCSAVLAQGPMQELSTGEAIKAALEQGALPAAITGTLERQALRKGPKAGLGTVLVTDDGATVWVSYASPPEGWELMVGKFVRVEGTLAPQSSATAQSLMAPHLVKPRAPVEVPRDVLKLIGKHVRLVGVAQNAKGGAVVLVNGSPVYVAGKSEWPEALRGKRVSLGGRLAKESYLPEATVSPRGEVSQGTSGGAQTVLRDASEPTAF